MSRTSRFFQAVGGIALAFLIGAGAFAAQDKAAPKADAQPQAKAETPAPAPAYAPAMPGWMKHLPADKVEAAKAIWLTDGRTVQAHKQMLKGKRHELEALLTLPGSDDKAVQALVKEIASYEEKLLTAEVALRRNLEKAGIPSWGHSGQGMGSMMGEGKQCMMMSGHDGAGHGKGAAAPAAPQAAEGGKPAPAHSGH